MSENDLDPKEKDKMEKTRALDEWHKNKVVLAHEWIDDEEKQMARTIVQGGIHLCELGENIGTEQNGERPVLIISNDRINTTSGSIKVIPLSKRLKTKVITDRKGKQKTVPRLASHYFLKREKYTFLARDSAVKAEELTTVNKVRLKRHLGNIDSNDLQKILNRVKWVFGL